MAWTENQRKAIETRGKNLLVAAAAGSGKTAVLVERIIRQVLAGECDVDRLLVVTFTHAAADEMRMRIEAALRRELETEAGEEKRERLARQMILLSGASISTLHSFCQTLIRQNFSLIDLDPEFRLAGEQELRILQQDVLEELFEREYERGDENFIRFVDAYGGDERGDGKLHELILRLYQFSQSQPFPEKWLSSLAPLLDPPEGKGLADMPWYEVILRDIRRNLQEVADENRQALAAAEALGLAPYVETLGSDGDLVEELFECLERGTWEGLRKAFSEQSFARMKAVRGMDPEVKELADSSVKKPRERCKTLVASLTAKYFQEPEAEIMEDMRGVSKDVAELSALTLAFAEAFAAAKREKAVVDFNDLEHFALAILCDGEEEGILRPSDVARTLQERFRAVMVDEYQDTNGVQEAILSLVADRERPDLFCVGDVKQSIYRFRLADPMLFLQKYREYPKKGEEYSRIDLSQNYRSRPEILSAINFVFAQVMSRGAMELDYDREAALYPGMQYPSCAGENLQGPVELDFLLEEGERSEIKESGEGEEEDLKGLELEAQFLANRLKNLMAAGTQVFDKEAGAYRPLQWRDIVILLRSVKGKADKVLEVLKNNNIPAYASADAGYFEEQEIRVMLALLSILHNARQDIPLAAVLASPIGGMSFQELAKIRLSAPEGDLYDALLGTMTPDFHQERELSEKVGGFLARLSRWRSLARELSVPELIWQLYRDTGYYDYAGGLPGGLIRQANLRLLVNRAAEYEKTEFRGLFRFLRFVERMKDMDTDLAVARVLGERENVVRIMSIHRSKGLEFPVVILADMGKKFNLMDASADFLMHRELGIGPYRVDLEASFRYPTLARQAVAAKILQENKAEELRLLYVAMTRAREKLILLGSLKSRAKLVDKLDKWARHVERTQLLLPEYASFGAESFLDWVGMSVMRHRDGALLRETASSSWKWAGFPDDEDTSHWQVELVSASDLPGGKAAAEKPDDILRAVACRHPLPDSPKREMVRSLLDWHYDMRGLEQVPSKLSVTEIKRRFAEDDVAESFFREQEDPPEWKRPGFLQKKGGLSSMEYGTLMHSVMQHVDYMGDVSWSGIEAQLEAMAGEEILLPEQMKRIRVKHIQAFFQSSIGQRMRRAKKVWREVPFSRMLPAREFYPGVEEGERLFIQGIIDLLFEEEDGGLVLVDYKTDKDTAPGQAGKRYRLQIDLYSRAVEDILQKRVKEKYLYMLHDGSIVSLSPESAGDRDPVTHA